jgi:hypothetical protein
MEINSKKIFSSIGFLASLIGSIPIAMSAPDPNIYTASRVGTAHRPCTTGAKRL